METQLFLDYRSSANLVVLEKGVVRSFPLEMRKDWYIGRENSTGRRPEIVMSSKIVSREHGKIMNIDGRWFYVDKGSTNGTYYNGSKLMITGSGESNAVELKNGDILRIDSRDLEHPEERGVWMLFTTESIGSQWNLVPLRKVETVFGRDRSRCDVPIPLPYVSGTHMKICRERDAFYLLDCDSKAGTYINNVISRGMVRLKEKDLISICDCLMIFTEGNILINIPVRGQASYAHQDPGVTVVMDHNGNIPDNSGSMNKQQREPVQSPEMMNKPVILKADIKSRKVPSNTGHGEKELIRNVRVEVCEGTLVALLGGAGAGKSTVMNCMNGMETVGMTGTVEYKGVDLIKNFDRMKSLIGSVPQAETFHEVQTVESELIHAARFRLPGDTSRKEIKERVDKTLKQLGIEAIRKNRISKCSGGERRRVNIGIELVADRQLLCLDEPDAGLDPGNKRKLFETLRSLAHTEGKSILTIIHDVSDIELFDKIIIMNKVDNVGRLAFAGTPEEARRHFGCEIKDVYQMMAKDPAKYVI